MLKVIATIFDVQGLSQQLTGLEIEDEVEVNFLGIFLNTYMVHFHKINLDICSISRGPSYIQIFPCPFLTHVESN